MTDFKLSFNNQPYQLLAGETVLEGLLRHGVNIPHSCKAGACQSCLMQAKTGEKIPAEAQVGLKKSEQSQNFFLACQCVPAWPLSVALPNMMSTTVEAEIIHKELLCHNVVGLTLKPAAPFACHAGQYVNLVRENGAAVRSYSVANLATEEGQVELHIKYIAGGATSTWAHKEAQVGEKINLRGPAGNCFYVPENGQKMPIFLAGTGTGLAPLLGVVRAALAAGHTGPIMLMHGALERQDLYHVKTLEDLAQAHSQFTYLPCVLAEGVDLIPTFLKNLEPYSALEKSNIYAFFCGAPDVVNQLKQRAFLAGLSSRHLFSDPFVLKNVE